MVKLCQFMTAKGMKPLYINVENVRVVETSKAGVGTVIDIGEGKKFTVTSHMDQVVSDIRSVSN